MRTARLLTVRELSGALHLHPKTVYNWKQRGWLPFVSIEGRVRFDLEEVDKFIRERSHVPLPLPPFPKVDLPLSEYDRLFLKGGHRGSMNDKRTRWNYGFGSVYVRKTKSGAERWCVRYYDENHKRVQKVVKNARSRQEAVVALNQEAARAFSREYGVGKELKRALVGQFAQVYLGDYAKLRKRSWRSDEKYLKAQLIPFFGEMQLSDIGPHDVNQFMAKRQADGVRNSTINRELTVLKKMLGLAMEWGYDIKKNPVKKGNYFPEAEFRRDRVLSAEEEERLFQAAAPHLKPILVCALATAMRYSEILGLRWKDVDLEKRRILVRAERSKSGKARVIPINSMLLAELGRLKGLNAGASELVFLYREPGTGKLRPVMTVRRAFERACARAGIENFRFHDLRHTTGSRLIERGADPISVKDLLGHANLKTTEIYLHSSFGRMKEAVELLNFSPGKRGERPLGLSPICNAEKKGAKLDLPNVFFSVN